MEVAVGVIKDSGTNGTNGNGGNGTTITNGSVIINSGGANPFPIPYLSWLLIEKGNINGIANTSLTTLEIGDTVKGRKDEFTSWEAIYEGGEPSDINSYTPLIEYVYGGSGDGGDGDGGDGDGDPTPIESDFCIPMSHAPKTLQNYNSPYLATRNDEEATYIFDTGFIGQNQGLSTLYNIGRFYLRFELDVPTVAPVTAFLKMIVNNTSLGMVALKANVSNEVVTETHFGEVDFATRYSDGYQYAADTNSFMLLQLNPTAINDLRTNGYIDIVIVAGGDYDAVAPQQYTNGIYGNVDLTTEPPVLCFKYGADLEQNRPSGLRIQEFYYSYQDLNTPITSFLASFDDALFYWNKFKNPANNHLNPGMSGYPNDYTEYEVGGTVYYGNIQSGYPADGTKTPDGFYIVDNNPFNYGIIGYQIVHVVNGIIQSITDI